MYCGFYLLEAFNETAMGATEVKSEVLMPIEGSAIG